MGERVSIRFESGGEVRAMDAGSRCVVVPADMDDSAGYFTVRVEAGGAMGDAEVLANDWEIGGGVSARVLHKSAVIALVDASARARVLVPTGPKNERGEQEWELAVVGKPAAKKPAKAK